MLQNIETLSPTTKRLTINIPSEIIQSETDSIYNRLQMTARIPGFRPGKVPRSLLEKRFGRSVEAEVIEKVVPKYYLEAIKEANIEPVSYPNIEDKISIKKGEPLRFTVTVEVKPELKDLNYTGIKIKKVDTTVRDDEVEKVLSLLRESKAVYSSTEDALKEGDMAIIDCEAFIGEELKEELSYKEYPYLIGARSMPEEISSALTGKKKGDSLEVKIKFEDDHPNKAIAGKEVLFKIKVKEGKKKNLPPIDDEFAKDENCQNIEELKNKIRENLKKKLERHANLRYKKEIMDELIKRHEFDIPASMVEAELSELIQNKKNTALSKGEKPKSDEELRKELEPVARENVKAVILLEAIGKKEGIKVTEDDINRAFEELAESNNLKPEEIKKIYAMSEGSIDGLKNRLFADKVLEFLLEKSEFVE